MINSIKHRSCCQLTCIISRAIVLITVLLANPQALKAQRTFIKNINGQNRSYVYYANLNDHQETLNLPLVVILHPAGSDAGKTCLKVMKELPKHSCNMVFPNGLGGVWNCDDYVAGDDIAFLNTIISDTYQDFRHDRNRVYIVCDTDAYCLVEQLKLKYPDLIAESRSIGSVDTELPQALKGVLSTKMKTSKKYKLSVEDDFAEAAPDSIERYSFYKRWVIDISAGGLYMFGNAKTGIKDGSNLDLSKAHSIKTVTLTKWFSNSNAWFAELSKLSVPKRNESVGQTTKLGSGRIVISTLGLKHAFLSSSVIHPYVMAGGGLIAVNVKGEKTDGSSSTPDLDSDYRLPLQVTLGGGIDFRITKRFVFGSNLRYIQSTKFSSLGKIDAIQGLNFNFSLGYVFNANNSKKPPLHKH